MGLQIEYLILLSNMLVTIGVFVATIYRIKIEKRQIETLVKNAKATERLRLLKKTLKKEKDQILGMSGKDILELLEEVCRDED